MNYLTSLSAFRRGCRLSTSRVLLETVMEDERANGPDPVPPCALPLPCDPWLLSACFIGGQNPVALFGAVREIGDGGVVGAGTKSIPLATGAGQGCVLRSVGRVSFPNIMGVEDLQSLTRVPGEETFNDSPIITWGRGQHIYFPFGVSFVSLHSHGRMF